MRWLLARPMRSIRWWPRNCSPATARSRSWRLCSAGGRCCWSRWRPHPVGWLATLRGGLVALHLGLVATAAAYVLFAAGLHRVAVARAATVSLAEPLTAAILGVALVGERLTTAGVAGAAVLVAGLAVLAAPSQTAATLPPSPGHRR